ESRLGLMFNAVFKIPMQFLILLLGVLVFVFYQFEPAPVFFNTATWQAQIHKDSGYRLRSLEQEFAALHAHKERLIYQWLEAKSNGDYLAEEDSRGAMLHAHQRSQELRKEVKNTLEAPDPRAK